MATVQRPSLYEPGIMTAMKHLLQNSKALGYRNGRTEVADSRMAEKSSGSPDPT